MLTPEQKQDAVQDAVKILVECYNYGCGYDSQPGFKEALVRVFTLHGYRYDDVSGAVSE